MFAGLFMKYIDCVKCGMNIWEIKDSITANEKITHEMVCRFCKYKVKVRIKCVVN